MSIRGRWIAILPALLFLGGSSLFGQAPYSVPARGAGFYYGHVSLSDHRGDGRDAFIFRSGEDRRDAAILNMPIVPGDVITVPLGRRLEVQFDNGTIVRLDGDTELAVETVMARALSAEAHMTTLTLRRGRIYIMYKQYTPTEIFQVATPESAVKLRHNCIAVIGVSGSTGTDVRVRAGRVDLLLGQRAEARFEKPVREGGRAVVDRVGRLVPSVSEADGAFEAWNETINKEFLARHEDTGRLPAPVRRASEAIRAFARRFGEKRGRWVGDYFGVSVWQPMLLADKAGQNWAPYQNGLWTKVGSELFWVSNEPWGWAPYHLGLWHWDVKLGWLWIPGSVFAGAWVDWARCGDYYSWRTGTLSSNYFWYFYDLISYLDGLRQWSFYWHDWPAIERILALREIWKTDLVDRKNPVTSSHWPPAWRPRVDPLNPGIIGGKKLRERMNEALQRSDPDVLASLLNMPDTSRVIARHELLAEDAAARSTPLAGFLRAWRSWEANSGESSRPVMRPVTGDAAAVSAAPAIPASGEASSRGTVMSGTSLGVRDWNPDAAYLASHGASVRYLAGSNQISCPELGMTSAKAAAGFRFVDVSSSEFRTVRNDGGASLPAGSSSRHAGRVEQPIQNPRVSATLAVAPPVQKGKEAESQAAKAGTTVIK